jgi:hypothetical protein
MVVDIGHNLYCVGRLNRCGRLMLDLLLKATRRRRRQPRVKKNSKPTEFKSYYNPHVEEEKRRRPVGALKKALLAEKFSFTCTKINIGELTVLLCFFQVSLRIVAFGTPQKKESTCERSVTWPGWQPYPLLNRQLEKTSRLISGMAFIPTGQEPKQGISCFSRPIASCCRPAGWTNRVDITLLFLALHLLGPLHV